MINAEVPEPPMSIPPLIAARLIAAVESHEKLGWTEPDSIVGGDLIDAARCLFLS